MAKAFKYDHVGLEKSDQVKDLILHLNLDKDQLGDIKYTWWVKGDAASGMMLETPDGRAKLLNRFRAIGVDLRFEYEMAGSQVKYDFDVDFGGP
eukprot:CAMPEP_0182522230 /NCGR_PEP_ID=MMETSP1323-20130603/127_1 /TAXON_ID=236787 /ORGANISM="Florenciella parvula, Strain RCC1693" /LENGTH=93 /DNA_ID=CAMNT_0024730303 /DNA_START=84 /DNA_END=365 /DNA_ORIENTATION=+